MLYFWHGYPGSASDPFTAGLARTLNALRYSFTFLAGNWRQAAANDESGIP